MEPVAGDTDRMETDRLLLRRFSGEDAEELALDLWEVLQDPKYREEVERRREWYLREYSWDKVAQRICSVMEKNERDKDQYRSAGV